MKYAALLVEIEGHWNGSEFQDTTNSGEKNVVKAFTFYKMEMKEASDRYITHCFMSRLHAYNGEINLKNEKNLISNEFSIKLLLDYEEKDGEKIVKKELLTKGIVNFGNGVITIYPDLDSFRNDFDNSHDLGEDWDAIIENVDFGNIPQLDGIDVPPFVCNMGKSSRNKKKPCGNYKVTYSEEGPSDQHQKFLDSVMLDKLKLDGEVKIDEEEATEEENEKLNMCPKNHYVGSFKSQAIRNSKRCLVPSGRYHNSYHVSDHRHSYGQGCANSLRNKHESDSDNEEDYYVNRDEMGDGDGKWHAKVRIVDSYGNIFDQGYKTKSTDRKLSKPQGVQNNMGCAEEIEDILEIKVYEMRGDEEIFTSEAWRRSFDINEPVYAELCHEFYETYEFDETVTDEDLMSKKLIKFRLRGRGHTLTILEFARHLGLYTSDEIYDEGFETYFLRGLRNDDHFNVNQYWSEISSENELTLSRSSARTIRKLVLRVLQKMITYGVLQRKTGYDKVQRNELWLMSMFEAKHQNGYANVSWLIAKWLKRKGVGSQRESMIFCGQFITKITMRANLLTDKVLNGFSAPVYYRPLDITTLRELIDSNMRLIIEELAPGDSRVVVPRQGRLIDFNGLMP
ncbi:hypothetical protein Tco_1204634 [Tanacetum coccineum]